MTGLSLFYGKEGRCVLFKDALNTFYLRLYGVGHMVKDHSDSERGSPLPPHRLLFPRGFFYMHHPTDRITHTTAIVTPVVDHWLEREIAPTTHRTMSECSYHGATSRSLILRESNVNATPAVGAAILAFAGKTDNPVQQKVKQVSLRYLDVSRVSLNRSASESVSL